MSKHDEFRDILADLGHYDNNPEDTRDNESTFSLHPVNGSYELTEDTLLGKDDLHFEDLSKHYLQIIKRQLQELYKKEER